MDGKKMASANKHTTDENKALIQTHLDSPQSVGEYLKQAREEKKLTVEQIAAEMRLGPAVIREIEADQMTGLPVTFAKGYIRSYAKIVGLNPDTLIAQYSVGREPENRNPFYQSHVEAEHSAPRASKSRLNVNFSVWKDKFKFLHIILTKLPKGRALAYWLGGIVVVILVIWWASVHHANRKVEPMQAIVSTPEAASQTPALAIQPAGSTAQSPATTQNVAPQSAEPAKAATPAPAANRNSDVTAQLNMDN